MGIMIVEANPVKFGKFAFRLRWAKDNPTANPPSPQASADFAAFTTGSDSDRKARLKNAGVTDKVTPGADPADNEEAQIDGSEIVILFDEESTSAGISVGKTLMVIPTARDLQFLWDIQDNIFKPEQRKKISKEEYAELGRYLLKRCR